MCTKPEWLETHMWAQVRVGGYRGAHTCLCVGTWVPEDGQRRLRGACPKLGLGPCGSLWLV